MNTIQQTQQIEDYNRIAQAIHYLNDHLLEQPTLDEMAAHLHLSKFHFQRLFKRWAGITPTQFLHYLTVEYAKEKLAQTSTIYDTSLDLGLSSAGRLYDHFVKLEGMTPGEYKERGLGLVIRFGFHGTPFGRCLLATTERGVCALRFFNEGEAESVLDEVRSEWSAATFCEDRRVTEPLAVRIFNGRSHTPGQNGPLHLHVRGTNFQLNVWKALLALPAGTLVTYQNVADAITQPTAVRAVASAVAKNPVGYLIPCHRVITKVGKIHRYRWGETRKKAMIGWEGARTVHTL